MYLPTVSKRSPRCVPEELWELPGEAPQPAPSTPRRGRPAGRRVADEDREEPAARLRHPLPGLVREWLLDLKVMGRSPRTIEWYEQKMRWYFDHEGGPALLEELTPAEVKRLLATLQDRGLAPNTVHGFFQVVRAFGNWALREGYPVDPALLRMRPPKVPIKEMETYSAVQMRAVLEAAPVGWSRLAVQILLGTGMRLSELAELTLEDIEDDGELCFLKIRSGKGAKFRRVPCSSRLRRELLRYLNRQRPDAKHPHLLITRRSEPADMHAIANLLRRIYYKVGFRVHAHKFRHTFATEYLRQGGEIERLRRILGHTSYVMVMRYLHLDKGDLGRDFDLRAPF